MANFYLCNLQITLRFLSMYYKNSTYECYRCGTYNRKTSVVPVPVRIIGWVETFQDFSIKLDIEPLMHLLKISIFSLNSDIIRLTKIMNNLVKDCKIRTFKVIFQCLKLVESFRKKNSVKNIWLGDQLLLMKFFENFDF